MIDAPAARRLAGEMIAHLANADAQGIAGLRLVFADDEFTKADNAVLHLAEQHLAAAAVAELASVYGCEPGEVIARLGFGDASS